MSYSHLFLTILARLGSINVQINTISNLPSISIISFLESLSRLKEYHRVKCDCNLVIYFELSGDILGTFIKTSRITKLSVISLFN